MSQSLRVPPAPDPAALDDYCPVCGRPDQYCVICGTQHDRARPHDVLVGANSAMTLHASDIGATVNNYLGRSQYAADPYFSGFIDDFRVYRRALTPEQIGALYNVR